MLCVKAVVVVRQGQDIVREILQAVKRRNMREAVGAHTKGKTVDIGERIAEHGRFFRQLAEGRNPQIDRGNPAAVLKLEPEQQARQREMLIGGGHIGNVRIFVGKLHHRIAAVIAK